MERFPQEWAQYEKLLARGEQVAEFLPERGLAGGWPVVILRFPAGGVSPLELRARKARP
jgi:hypothetical protein